MGSQGREGHLFGGPLRLTPCDDDEQAKQKWIYALTNAVKDGITATTRRSPLFNTYRIQALGQTQRYWDIRYRDYHAAGGPANKRIRAKDFLTWYDLEITPLPCFAGMKPEQIQTFVRQQVREQEEHKADENKREGRSFMAVPKLFDLDPRDKPQGPRKKGARQPLIHASGSARFLASHTGSHTGSARASHTGSARIGQGPWLGNGLRLLDTPCPSLSPHIATHA